MLCEDAFGSVNGLEDEIDDDADLSTINDDLSTINDLSVNDLSVDDNDDNTFVVFDMEI